MATADDMIRQAGSQLFELWRNPKRAAMPENDLNPRTDTIAFHMRVLAQQIDGLERRVRAIEDLIRNAQRKTG